MEKEKKEKEGEMGVVGVEQVMLTTNHHSFMEEDVGGVGRANTPILTCKM